VKNPVATTWLISFKQIRYRDPLAADYLSFMVCIDLKDIPQSLLPAGVSRKRETDAIGTLGTYSLIIRRPADLALDLHRLVHLATWNWLRKEELITQWTEMAMAAGTRGRQQVLVGGNKKLVGGNKKLVGGSRNSWEVAGTRVPVGVSRYLLGKTARCSLVSGH